MIMVISPGRQSTETLLCQECINVICREDRDIFINSAQEVVYGITVSVDSIFFKFLFFASLRIWVKISSYIKTSLIVVSADTTTYQEVRWHHNSDCGRRL